MSDRQCWEALTSAVSHRAHPSGTSLSPGRPWSSGAVLTSPGWELVSRGLSHPVPRQELMAASLTISH